MSKIDLVKCEKCGGTTNYSAVIDGQILCAECEYEVRAKKFLANPLKKHFKTKDQQISELQHQLKVSEKATILACGEINKCPYEFCPNDIDGNKLVSKVYGSVCAKCHYDYFKQLAEKEVEND